MGGLVSIGRAPELRRAPDFSPGGSPPPRWCSLTPSGRTNLRSATPCGWRSASTHQLPKAFEKNPLSRQAEPSPVKPCPGQCPRPAGDRIRAACIRPDENQNDVPCNRQEEVWNHASCNLSVEDWSNSACPRPTGRTMVAGDFESLESNALKSLTVRRTDERIRAYPPNPGTCRVWVVRPSRPLVFFSPNRTSTRIPSNAMRRQIARYQPEAPARVYLTLLANEP